MLHPDATTIRLIHQHMIEEELGRHRGPDRDGPERPGASSKRAPGLRHSVATLLRAVAGRIDPSPPFEPPLSTTKPAG